MLTNKFFNKYIKFEKTIEDLFFDSSSGFFHEMADQDGDGNFTHYNVPKFIIDALFDPDNLDMTFYSKFSERWLNKTGGNSYSTDIDGNLVNPSDLGNLVQQTIDYFYQKWDNLYYLYYTIVMGEDYNPIENYSSKEKTTYNSLKDELVKTGVERNSQKQKIKQKPMKTITRVSDEYGTKNQGTGLYEGGIKDKTQFNRKYKSTDISGSTGNNAKPFVSTDEKGIAGMNSSGTFGSSDASDIPASGGISGYAQSDMNIHTEMGEHSQTYEDVSPDNVSLPYEETERTGKHSSTSEFGGDIQNGAVVQGDLQIITELDDTENYNELSFRPDANNDPRKDTNTRTGNVEVEKTGNIGVMTASQMLESAWNGEQARNFIETVIQDVADFISLKCY